MKIFTMVVWLIILLMVGVEVAGADMIDDLVPVIIMAESSGNPNAVGKGGEIGLMQISSVVLKEWNTPDNYWEGRMSYDKYDLYCANINVIIGIWYLERMKDRLEEHNLLDKAHLIYAYNAGLSRALNNPIPKSHKNLIYRKIYKEYWRGKI